MENITQPRKPVYMKLPNIHTHVITFKSAGQESNSFNWFRFSFDMIMFLLDANYYIVLKMLSCNKIQ